MSWLLKDMERNTKTPKAVILRGQSSVCVILVGHGVFHFIWQVALILIRGKYSLSSALASDIEDLEPPFR